MMRLKGATTLLKKEMDFLGLTWKELEVFIERNPYAVHDKVIEAFVTYRSAYAKESLV